MIRRQFLFSLAADAGDNAGPGATPPPLETNSAENVPANPAAPLPPAAAPKQSVLQMLNAAISSKATLQTNLATANAELTNLRATLATCQTDLQSARTDLLTAQTDLTAARAEVTKLKAEASTVADQIAQLGFSQDQLPEQHEGPPASTAGDLQAAYAAEKDPEKKAQIFEKIKAARAAENAPKQAAK
jgi:septal ring factor EnvC (AmiA/AmiB activator)